VQRVQVADVQTGIGDGHRLPGTEQSQALTHRIGVHDLAACDIVEQARRKVLIDPHNIRLRRDIVQAIGRERRTQVAGNRVGRLSIDRAAPPGELRGQRVQVGVGEGLNRHLDAVGSRDAGEFGGQPVGRVIEPHPAHKWQRTHLRHGGGVDARDEGIVGNIAVQLGPGLFGGGFPGRLHWPGELYQVYAVAATGRGAQRLGNGRLADGRIERDTSEADMGHIR
jgi:hypothetical protein